MRFRHLLLGIACLSAFVSCGCSGVFNRPSTIEVPIVPSDILDFKVLFAQNCSGCHGPEGKGGAAIALADPVYLAVADDTVVRRAAANGIPGTAMPAFAQSAGGMLTSKQIDVIVGVFVNAGRSRMFCAARIHPRTLHPSLGMPRADRRCTPTTVLPVTALGAEADKRRAQS